MDLSSISFIPFNIFAIYEICAALLTVFIHGTKSRHYTEMKLSLDFIQSHYSNKWLILTSIRKVYCVELALGGC
jgi:hypothetical protein